MALNEDQYEESGWSFMICPPFLPCPISETRTRRYVNGHPTNGFAKDGGIDWWCCTLLLHLLCIGPSHARKCGGGDLDDIDWYHDPGYARKEGEDVVMGISRFAKKLC